MHFGKNNPRFDFFMRSTTGDYQIASTLIEKDLTIYFDPSLKFTQHIAEIVKKANCRLGLIRSAFTSLDVQLFRVLYKSLVRPILEYGNAIWNPLFKKDILNLEKVQWRATKLVYVIKDMPYEVRLEYLDLPTFTRK
ncbi:hypothetical protein HOLleu_39652 [Holothuria leucospilota]|uniref:Uncharacterized protein n=1 Tax=Holothuria leucospilota TaxID=206669 RepID=A0A9Q0YIX6_HOLLE|nr:hypothetical protein HOLleu_39652 [Holothuria leucospilota]